MMQRPVGVSGVGRAAAERHADGVACRGRTRCRGRRRRPCRCTRPRPPRLATPHIVLAADPPLISTAVPSAPYRCTARSVSISSIEPLTSSWSSRNASAAWAMTSTSALPIPTTSKRGPARAGNATGAPADATRAATAGARTPQVPLPPMTAIAGEPRPSTRTASHAARVPTRYDVELAPDLAAATFDGRVEIAVDVVEPVDELVLNAIELEIAEVRVDGSDVQWHLEPATERLVISPVGGLAAGHASASSSSFTGHPQRQAARLLPQHVHATTPAPSRSSPPPRCRPPTAAGRSRAGTSPTSRPSFAVTLVIDPVLTRRLERPGGRAQPSAAAARSPSASPTRW